METMTPYHLPPLRWATLEAMRHGVAVPVETLARLAEVEESRAKAYLSILVANGILAETTEGVVAGPKWSTWSANQAPSHQAHGGSDSAAEVMRKMRIHLRSQVQTIMDQRGWSTRFLATRAGVAVGYVAKLRARGQPPPACELALIAKALESSVEALLGI